MASPLSTKALWLEARRRPALRDGALEPFASADRSSEMRQIRVAARFGAVSRGTERLVAAGEVPPSEYARMRSPFQEGDFPFPVKYGYAVIADVEEGPADLLGRTVFCLHPHQDRFLLPAAAARRLPENVPPERAVMAANMETALNVVWDAAVQPGDRVAVIGAGLVGLLVAHLASGIVGADVVIVDVDPAREWPAAALGLAFAAPDDTPQGCDVVIHASGAPAGLATALGAAGFEGRVVEASWYGTREVPAPLGRDFHAKRLALVSSQVGHVPAARRARWSRERRLDLALRLLADDRLDALISGETPFADLPGAYLAILDDPRTLCHRIRY